MHKQWHNTELSILCSIETKWHNKKGLFTLSETTVKDLHDDQNSEKKSSEVHIHSSATVRSFSEAAANKRRLIQGHVRYCVMRGWQSTLGNELIS